MKKVTLTFLLAITMTILYSQKKIDIVERPGKNAISVSFFGPTPVLGITYERILTRILAIEVGIGFPSAGLGLKFYPVGLRINQPMFHVGITATYFASEESEMTPAPTFLIYIPFGISVFKKRGFNFVFDLGPGYAWDRFIPYGNLKFGYRF